jgi:hypothetical protein
MKLKKDNKSLAFLKNNSKRKTVGLNVTVKQQQEQQESKSSLTIKRQKKSLFKHKNDTDKCAKTTLRSIGVSLVNLFKINVRNLINLFEIFYLFYFFLEAVTSKY